MAFEKTAKQWVFETAESAKSSGDYNPDVHRIYRAWTPESPDTPSVERFVIASNQEIALGKFADSLGCSVELSERKSFDPNKRAMTYLQKMLENATPEDKQKLIAMFGKTEDQKPGPKPQVSPEDSFDHGPEQSNKRGKKSK